MIYFTRFAHNKSIKMLSMHYHELAGKTEELKEKKYLMVENNRNNKK